MSATVKSYGCQMNVYDSQRIVEILAEDGVSQSMKLEDADIFVMNTCNIREKANDKVLFGTRNLGELEGRENSRR